MGFLVGLTLIHNINLNHPAETVKTCHAALKLDMRWHASVNERSQLTVYNHFRFLFPASPRLCVREDRANALFDGLKPLALCVHLLVSTRMAPFMKKCLQKSKASNAHSLIKMIICHSVSFYSLFRLPLLFHWGCWTLCPFTRTPNLTLTTAPWLHS